MAKDIDQTIYLKDYTPPAYLIDKTELTFHLDPTKTRVSSRIAFRPNPDAKINQFILDGAEMKLIWAKINGAPSIPQYRRNTFGLCRAKCPIHLGGRG